METTLGLTDILTVTAVVFSGVGIVLTVLFWMNSTINRRFDDAQRANDQAHVHIGDNIKNLERRVDSLERHVDSGLANVHMQLAALTPRAAPATEPPEPARTPRP